MKRNYALEAAALLDRVRKRTPLVHHITNYVTVNDCANITLAIGASPIMADDAGEVDEIVSVSSALVLNIGTLNQRTFESMQKAGKKANQYGIPVILDPVGAGASALRNDVAKKLVEGIRLSVLRGNMSEIRFIAGLSSSGKGVDASDADIKNGIRDGITLSQTLSKKLGCVVAITGATDIISDGSRVVLIENGHAMLKYVTGTGCMSTSLIGSCCAATEDCLLGAVSGLLSMGIAGELAYQSSGKIGTGSFRISIIDSISKLTDKLIIRMANVHENESNG